MPESAQSMIAPGHVVGFYEAGDDLVGDVSPYLADGLVAGAPAVVVATADHQAAFDRALLRTGVDVAGAVADGIYVRLDAAATLARVTVDGEPDRERFMRVIGGVLAGVSRHGSRVRAFGEMVGLLWDRGAVLAAIELEALWNDLLARHDAALYCAYPATALDASTDLVALAGVCGEHGGIVGPCGAALVEPGSKTNMTEVAQVFVPTTLAPRAARRFVADTLRAWHADQLVPDATVVASELATNAVVHAASPFKVTLERGDTDITVAVYDVSPVAPRRRARPLDALDGRGVPLVAGLAARWGTERRSDGKVVWASFPTSR